MSIRSEKTLVAGLAIYGILVLGSQATMSIGIGILLLASLAAFGGPKPFFQSILQCARTPEMNRYLRAVNFLTLACFLSLLFAQLMPVEMAGKKPEVKWLTDMWKAWYFYWPLVTVTGLGALSEPSRKRVFQVFLGAFGIVALIGCFQYFTGWPRPQPIPGMNRFHVTVFPGHHLSFASIAIFPFFLALSEILDRRWISRNAAIAVSVLGLAALIGTYSRQVWISLPFGLLVFALIRLPRKAAIATAFAGAIALLVLFQIPEIRARVESGMGITERLELWKINFEFFKLRPLTGIGWHHNLQMAGAYYQQFKPEVVSPFVGHAHSNFFEFLGGLGLIGVASYFFWSLTTLRQALRAGAGFFAAWVVFHLNGLTQVNLWESKVMHSMMWSMAMILVLLMEKSGTRESEPKP